MRLLDRKLLDASANGRTDEVKALIGQGADVNSKDTWDRTCLHASATSGDIETVKLLIFSGADIHSKDSSCRRAVHRAAVIGSTEVMLALIEAGADVNAMDNLNRTALHLAAMMGNASILPALIAHGAELNPIDIAGNTPLSLAASDKERANFLTLIAYGAVRSQPGKILHHPNISGITMRQAAVEAGLVDRLQVLLDQHPAEGDQDSPEALVNLAFQHNQRDAAAVLQAHMAAKAIDDVLQPASTLQARA